MAGKPIRLGKAAGELNVGLPTLVEFLESKGIKIDSNPNTRLEQEHFELLCQEFAADQSMKEQSKATTRREKRESVTLSDKPADTPRMQDSSEDEDEGDAINLDEIKRQVYATEKPVVVTPEPPKEPEVAVEPKEIDDINILNASFLAMHRAIDQLKTMSANAHRSFTNAVNFEQDAEKVKNWLANL